MKIIHSYNNFDLYKQFVIVIVNATHKHSIYLCMSGPERSQQNAAKVVRTLDIYSYDFDATFKNMMRFHVDLFFTQNCQGNLIALTWAPMDTWKIIDDYTMINSSFDQYGIYVEQLGGVFERQPQD